MADQPATGARHPIADHPQAWQVSRTLHAWMAANDPLESYPPDRGPFVIIEDQVEGQIICVPGNLLWPLAQGLIAAYVDSGRTDRWPPPPTERIP